MLEYKQLGLRHFLIPEATCFRLLREVRLPQHLISPIEVPGRQYFLGIRIDRARRGIFLLVRHEKRSERISEYQLEPPKIFPLPYRGSLDRVSYTDVANVLGLSQESVGSIKIVVRCLVELFSKKEGRRLRLLCAPNESG